MKTLQYHAITDICELIPNKEERKGGEEEGREGGMKNSFNQHILKNLPRITAGSYSVMIGVAL